MKSLLFIVFLLSSASSIAQFMDLKMGRVNRVDLEMKGYPKDTTAGAVILNEMGQAHISNDRDEGLVFERYLKIKILKRSGFDEANFEILLHRNETREETLASVLGSTTNLENGTRKELKLDPKTVFKIKDKNFTTVKFTLPDIREGSVIEVLYTIHSPFYFNFRSWRFQDDIPKIHSEYWALIPANWIYNIALRGFYKLSKNESSLVNDCYNPGGAAISDCALFKYAMDDVPAFVEEEHMTAPINFISALHFELSEIHKWDGQIDKITKEWKDVDDELRKDDEFGQQIRKARNVLEDQIKAIADAEPDTLKKAKLIFEFIKKTYRWNDYYGFQSDAGTKKIFDSHTGNVADINLSLVGALQSAGLNANPVILSTRRHGTVIDLFPVLSNFNYVIGMVEIGHKRYFLDATNPLYAFGFLTEECLNGKGRLMTKPSSWIDLKPADKKKTTTSIDLTMTESGDFVGKATIQYSGYAAFTKREDILRVSDRAAYRKKLQDRAKEMEITNYELENLDDLEKTLVEKIEFTLASSTPGTTVVYLSPFIFSRIDKNPFRSSERLYPVDFGAPWEEVVSLNLSLTSFQVDELPSPIALSLSQGSGRFLFNVSKFTDRVTVTSNLSINRSVYASGDYQNIKELFARIVQAHQSQIVLKKKT